MKLFLLTVLAIAGISLSVPQTAYAHCEIPCGIYDDPARVKMMLEDTATVAKSMKLINEMSSKSDALSKNQLVRWINNKEKHAQNIISTISDYFLTQRVKPTQKDYVERLKKHHAVIIAAMKAKQNVDIKYAEELKKCIEALRAYYPEEHHHH
jgi:nickel superoxide dismutase